MRGNGAGTLRPPFMRATASEIVAFHRQRVWKTGASRNA
jgi:hypothetical protein